MEQNKTKKSKKHTKKEQNKQQFYTNEEMKEAIKYYKKVINNEPKN